jgi:hypothetical protein
MFPTTIINGISFPAYGKPKARTETRPLEQAAMEGKFQCSVPGALLKLKQEGPIWDLPRFYSFFFADFFFGAFAPFFLASESPMATACLRLVTFLPDLPLFKVPFFCL